MIFRDDITVTREGLVIASPERGIRTKVVIEDGHYIIKTEADITGLREHNHELASAGLDRTFGNGHHVGRIPVNLYREKTREFGGDFGDDDPRVKAKWSRFLNSNEYRALRVSGKAL